MKRMFKRHSELQLEKDVSGRFLPYLIAVMIFLAGLSLGAAVSLNGAVANWTAAISASLTVEIADDRDADMNAREAEAVDILRATPGIRAARALSQSELEALLEPWLGRGNMTLGLPVPRLIDVTLEPGTPLNLDSLQAQLAAKVPGAQVDDHKSWLERLIRLTRTMQLLAYGIVALIGFATVTIVIFATRAGLAMHHDVIELLHLIGARDRYIARQFQDHFLRMSLFGAVPGLLLALIAMFVLDRLIQGLEAPMLPSLQLGLDGWLALAMLPPVAALLALLTARLTVLRVLRRMT